LRVRIIFNLKVKGGSVPFHHQFLLAQFIKGVLIRGGDDLLKENQAYNFSALKGQTRIGRNGDLNYSQIGLNSTKREIRRFGFDV